MARVMVIDDDRIQRAVAAQALKIAGHDVLEAVDGAQGLEKARTEHPDIIICDVVMPGMNGFEFVTALRKEDAVAAIPVMMLTSMSDRANMRAGMNAGADDYLAKPFSFEELNEAVGALLAKRRTLQEGLINSMNTSFVAALDEQRESLASQYEKRLVEEVNARWERHEQADFEVRYEHAVLLKADILGTLTQNVAGAAGKAAMARKGYDAARDAVHLFNAAHVLPEGSDIVAVYADEAGSLRVPAAVRALRASLALLKSLASLRDGAGSTSASGTNAPGAPSVPAANIALHVGPVTVLRVSDPLHGGPDSTLATGDVMRELDAMCDFARASHWGVAASPAFVGLLGGQALTGRHGQAAQQGEDPEPLDVVEVLSLR